jgi:hypothetical protein
MVGPTATSENADLRADQSSPLPRRRDFRLDTDRACLTLLLIANVAVFGLLSAHHAFVAMWVEGSLFEHVEHYLRIFGLSDDRPGCWIGFQWGGVERFVFPLSYNAYGGIAVYSYLPLAFLWYSGATSDPFIYRYLGIALLIGNSFLMFYLIRLRFRPIIALYGSLILLTTPSTLLASVTDHQTFTIYQFFFLFAAILVVRYLDRPTNGRLAAAAFASGMILLGRYEVLLWPLIAGAIYLVWVRPAPLLLHGRTIHQRILGSALAASYFCVGAAPTLLFQATCSYNAFSVMRRFGDVGVVDGVSASFVSKIIIRLGHYWGLHLLNQLPSYEIYTPNVLFAIIWLFAFAGIVLKQLRSRTPDILILILLVSLPLSTLTTGLLRYEHLLFLQPVFVLALIAGLGWWIQFDRLKVIVHVLFVALIISNVAVSVLDLTQWQASVRSRTSMLNQADPEVLADYLAKNHGEARILYTNVGPRHHMPYITKNGLEAEDILNWSAGVKGFAQDVRRELSDGSRQRVFVAVSPDRDGCAGTLPRTKALYAILDQSRIPYTTTPLASGRNPQLYDIIVVEKGIALPASPMEDAGDYPDVDPKRTDVTSVKCEPFIRS